MAKRKRVNYEVKQRESDGEGKKVEKESKRFIRGGRECLFPQSQTVQMAS